MKWLNNLQIETIVIVALLIVCVGFHIYALVQKIRETRKTKEVHKAICGRQGIVLPSEVNRLKLAEAKQSVKQIKADMKALRESYEAKIKAEKKSLKQVNLPKPVATDSVKINTPSGSYK